MSTLYKLLVHLTRHKGNISKGWILMNFFTTLLLFAVVALLGCAAQKEIWPQEVVNSLWVPKGANITERYHRGTYFIAYTLNVCYPVTVSIDDMEMKMNTIGWKKLMDDPVNPSSDPSKSGIGKWHHGFDDRNQPIHTRRDFWEDEKKNVIEYRFSYGDRYGQGKKYEECLLEGSSRYISGGLLRALQDNIKEVDQRAAERARKELEGRKN
jgi:hypothetical protein